ncbi:MAG: dephospho-CoA kinase [Xanthomonadales bacterium]|nr:dephospho-CoA kinase [Xanthomonadales bacterium]
MAWVADKMGLSVLEQELNIQAPNPQSPEIFVVVLTGGIASGKTAVSRRFAELGAGVVDTDVIARQVVEPGQPALQRITLEFGPEFIDQDGRLDRRRMREAVFADPQCRARLEAILHPAIAAEAREQVFALDAPYCILVIPLFAESSRYPWVNRVLVVDAPERLQIERVMERDQVSRGQAQSILDAQASRAQRLALADDVLVNEGSLEELEGKVDALHECYLALALEKGGDRG